MPGRHSKEVKEAITLMFESTIYQLMIGMVKAKSNETEYADVPEAARTLTQNQMKVISRYAAEYLVEKTKPSPEKVSQERFKALKRRAFDHALRRLENENKKNQK
jgi:hypothetical protein